MIDGDLQHPPEYIPQMIEVTLKVMIKWLLKKSSGREFCVRKTLSRCYYKLINAFVEDINLKTALVILDYSVDVQFKL